MTDDKMFVVDNSMSSGVLVLKLLSTAHHLQLCDHGQVSSFLVSSLFIYLFNLFIFGCIGSSVAVYGLSLVAVSGGYSSCGMWASHPAGFSCCRAWALGTGASVVASRGLSICGSRALERRLKWWRTGLVAPQHVGSSRTRARIHVPCIGRRILNHCATREAPWASFLTSLCLNFFISQKRYLVVVV